MTKASDLVAEAYREMNVIPVGMTPSVAQAAEGLKILNRFLQSVFGFLMGEPLSDWHVPFDQRSGTVAADYPFLPGAQKPLTVANNAYPPPNRRIVWDGSTRTVYFPDKPSDGARMQLVKASGANATAGTLTLDGNGNFIEDAATTSPTGDDTLSWLYRADLANWMALATLSGTDEMIFPEELDDLWPCAVAIRLSPRYGKALLAGTTETYKRMLDTLRTRYQQAGQEGSRGDELVPAAESYYGSGWSDYQP